MHDLFALEGRVKAYQSEVELFLRERALLARANEPAPEPARQAPVAACAPCTCAA